MDTLDVASSVADAGGATGGTTVVPEADSATRGASALDPELPAETRPPGEEGGCRAATRESATMAPLSAAPAAMRAAVKCEGRFGVPDKVRIWGCSLGVDARSLGHWKCESAAIAGGLIGSWDGCGETNSNGSVPFRDPEDVSGRKVPVAAVRSTAPADVAVIASTAGPPIEPAAVGSATPGIVVLGNEVGRPSPNSRAGEMTYGPSDNG